MPTLEDRITELAARGELVHLSITGGNTDGFRASFCPSSTYGASHAAHKNPIDALNAAIDGAKMKRRRTVSKPGEDSTPETDMDFG
jgi:hypothetical protein